MFLGRVWSSLASASPRLQFQELGGLANVLAVRVRGVGHGGVRARRGVSQHYSLETSFSLEQPPSRSRIPFTYNHSVQFSSAPTQQTTIHIYRRRIENIYLHRQRSTMPIGSVTADTLPEHPPKEAIPMCEDRIWIDGCFDFTHHGTAPTLRSDPQYPSY